VYRLLERGEVIESGDEAWNSLKQRWESLIECAGQMLCIADPTRRLVCSSYGRRNGFAW